MFETKPVTADRKVCLDFPFCGHAQHGMGEFEHCVERVAVAAPTRTPEPRKAPSPSPAAEKPTQAHREPRKPANENEHLWALINAPRNKDLNATAKAVIMVVSKSAHAKGGVTELSYSRIADMAGCSPSSAQRAVDVAIKQQWLRRANYTKAVKAGKSPTAKYRPTVPAWL
ncbi:hypothetical protein [Streptomyces sp. NPDC002104]